MKQLFTKTAIGKYLNCVSNTQPISCEGFNHLKVLLNNDHEEIEHALNYCKYTIWSITQMNEYIAMTGILPTYEMRHVPNIILSLTRSAPIVISNR